MPQRQEDLDRLQADMGKSLWERFVTLQKKDCQHCSSTTTCNRCWWWDDFFRGQSKDQIFKSLEAFHVAGGGGGGGEDQEQNKVFNNAAEIAACATALFKYFERNKRKRRTAADEHTTLCDDDDDLIQEFDSKLQMLAVMPRCASQENLIHGDDSSLPAPTPLINGHEIQRGVKQQLLNHIAKLNMAAVEASHDKSSYPLACAVCSSGGGKTTLLWLITTSWRTEITKALGVGSFRVAFATFNNTCSITSNEKRIFRRPGARLGARLLASYRGCSMSCLEGEVLNSHDNARYGQLSLQRFLNKLSPHSSPDSTPSVSSLPLLPALVILVDELLTIDATQEEMQELLFTLSAFQQRELSRGQRKVLIVVTSLSSTEISSLAKHRCNRPLSPLSLPMLSPQQVLQEAQQFAQSYGYAQNDDDDEQSATRMSLHNIISQLCATGGHWKSMSPALDFLNDPSNNNSSGSWVTLCREDSFAWSARTLELSVFGEWVHSEMPVSIDTAMSRHHQVQYLVDNHFVSITNTKKNSQGAIVFQLHITVPLLLSIAAYATANDLSESLRSSLSGALAPLTDLSWWGGGDGRSQALASPTLRVFEVAVAHILCLRLGFNRNISFEQLLPGGRGAGFEKLRHSKISQLEDPPVVRFVPTLSKTTMNHLQQQHRTAKACIVLSEPQCHDGLKFFGTEGCIVLGTDHNNEPHILFLRVLFGRVADSDHNRIQEEWERTILYRATTEFGLKHGMFSTGFFSTASSVEKGNVAIAAGNSCVWGLNALLHLFTPLGIAPLLLYTLREEQEHRLKR